MKINGNKVEFDADYAMFDTGSSLIHLPIKEYTTFMYTFWFSKRCK